MGQQIFGKIHAIHDIQKINENFFKRDFVVRTDDQFPQTILMELHHDNVFILDEYKKGDIVTVTINLKGRSWTNPQGEEKFFNTIVAWKIERSPANNVPSPNNIPLPQAAPEKSTAFDPNMPVYETYKEPSLSFSEEEADDLPF